MVWERGDDVGVFVASDEIKERAEVVGCGCLQLRDQGGHWQRGRERR